MARIALAVRTGIIGSMALFLISAAAADVPPVAEILKKVPARQGVCLLVDPPPAAAVEFARAGQWLVRVQVAQPAQAQALRDAARDTGLLGRRLFIDHGRLDAIPLASNTADLMVYPERSAPPEAEILRALAPGGRAIVGDRTIVKPLPAGVDSWSHPYHGPDNNTQSTDQLARWPYLTQYLAEPLFSSQPEVTVGAGGRIFKAFGHMTFRAYQNPSINQLFAISAFNGTMLWKQQLKPGFMIHRNTLIATPDILYMGDNESCKLIDAATGEVKDQIVVPDGVSDGPVWKWMAIKDGVLYALVGGREVEAPVARGTQTQIGGWPWGMWPGYDYADPKSAWGFGRTLIAIDLKTRKTLWNCREQEYLDSRGVCLSSGRIFYYSPDKFLACIDTSTGQKVWRTQDPEVLDAIGPNGRAQHYITGFSTSVYMRTDGKVLMFAGPQRRALAAISADNGRLLWKKDGGNFQLVLRDSALYALGQQGTRSYKLDLASGKVLAEFSGRRACTRATGSIDSVFCRAQEGTLRWDLATDALNHIAPMRPACHDGVIISDGQLVWGPWICGCHLTLVGIIGLGPAGDFNFAQPADPTSQLQTFRAGDVKEFRTDPADWPAFLGDSARTRASKAKLAANPQKLWTIGTDSVAVPTAPVAAGGLLLVGDTDGRVLAVDAATGATRWQAQTGSSIFFPPAIAQDRVCVGSNDGHVYAFEAATGAPLWRYRVAPATRELPVYGQIMSTWPVAGGVVVSGGTVYAAAGISHFDGTHLCALDAATGKLKWHNGGAGTLDPEVKNGISLCGALKLAGDELTFPGGNVFAVAQFDARTGKCLNTPAGARTTRRIFLFPRKLWEPIDAAEHQTSTGVVRVASRPKSVAAMQPASGSAAKPWSIPLAGYAGSLVTPDAWLALVRLPAEPETWKILAVNLADGKQTWQSALPGAPVHHGLAIDAAARVFVSLESGGVMAFGSK